MTSHSCGSAPGGEGQLLTLCEPATSGARAPSPSLLSPEPRGLRCCCVASRVWTTRRPMPHWPVPDCRSLSQEGAVSHEQPPDVPGRPAAACLQRPSGAMTHSGPGHCGSYTGSVTWAGRCVPCWSQGVGFLSLTCLRAPPRKQASVTSPPPCPALWEHPAPLIWVTVPFSNFLYSRQMPGS